MLDKYNRNINYLRVSVTDLCNLSCKYCSANDPTRVKHSDLLSIEQLVTVIKVFKELGMEKVRFTGGEPLVRKGIIELIKQTSNLIPNISLTTNGHLLKDYIYQLKDAGLKSINISLDCLDESKYKMLTGGDISNVIEGINLAHNLGLKIKINAVLLKGINTENFDTFLDFISKYDARIRFIELMPFSKTKEFFNKYYISSEEMIKKYNMKYLYSEGTAEYYQYKNYEIGFIRPISNKFCSNCNRIRLTSKGEILPCLHSSTSYGIKEYVDDYDALKERIEEIIYNKPKEHHILDGDLQVKEMRDIGG